MTVVARLFATLHDLAGVARVELSLPEPSTAEDAWRALVLAHPPLSSRRPSLTVAVNRRYARWDEPLAPGDEIAFIPPVSGG